VAIAAAILVVASPQRMLTDGTSASPLGARAFVLSLEESTSHKFICSGILGEAGNGPIPLKELVAAGGFEPPTPCAQRGRHAFSQPAFFQLFPVQWVAAGLLKILETR
jgi:hypothetical protein